MKNRPGVTLMEVLVAIFIMGIGMLAMLVLFPLGVLRMAQALQDERCAQTSRIATAIAQFMGVRNDPWVLGDPNAISTSVGPLNPPIVVTVTNGGNGYAAPPLVTFAGGGGSGAAATAVIVNGQVTAVIVTSSGTNYTTPPSVSLVGGTNTAAAQANFDAFANPWVATGPPPPPLTHWLPADPNGPSYPVFVDPMAYYSLPGDAKQFWLAGTYGSTTIPRRTASYALAGSPLAPTNGLAMRWTCLLDDMIFATDSTPQYDVVNPPVPGTFTRDVRYCWAYMLKRPRTADRSVVDMSVVVFNNNRPILSSVINEYLYQNVPGGISEVTFDPTPNACTITIDVTQSGNVVPPCRPGDWLLDASYVPNQAGTYATINGYFYRVVAVNANSDTSITFAVQQQLRNMPATMAINPATGVTYATQKVIFLEGVAEVFEKGPGRLP